MPKTIVVDLDGTILEYGGWRDHSHFGKPIPKAKESLQKLKERGYIIIIWTTRNNKEEIAHYLKKLGIPFDYINENPFQPPDCSNKIYADYYVDDRAIEFRGDWQEVLGKILWKNGKKRVISMVPESIGSRYWEAVELVRQAAKLVGAKTIRHIIDGLKYSSNTSIELLFCENCLYPGYEQNVAATRVYDLEGYYLRSTWEGKGERVCPECGGSIAHLYIPYDTFQKLEAVLIDIISPEKLRQAKLVVTLILTLIDCADLDEIGRAHV